MPTHQIAVEGLHKSYGQIEVLKGISLAADKGEVITLIGSSGSGKSTLLHCLNWLEVPSAGPTVSRQSKRGLGPSRPPPACG
jgi:ABC-type histidine transport system ATPase subunit